MIDYLIEHGANINCKVKIDDNGICTPLTLACKNNSKSIIKCLLEHGADINKRDGNNMTPLGVACEQENENLVKYLLEHGANINCKVKINDHEICTPLTLVCKNNNKSIIKCLLEHGADINKRDGNNMTPLGVACEQENENLVKYLIEHGANVNKKYEIKNYAEYYYRPSNKYLSKIDIKTPLIPACEKNNISIVKYLIEHGANTNTEYTSYEFSKHWKYSLENYKIKTPSCIANENKNMIILNYLKKHGACNKYRIENKNPLNNLYKYKSRKEENYFNDEDEILKIFDRYLENDDKEKIKFIKKIPKTENCKKTENNKKIRNNNNNKYKKIKKNHKQK